MSQNSIVPGGSTADFTRTASFDPTKPVRLTVSNHDGEVRVRRTDGSDIVINGFHLRSRGNANGDVDENVVFEVDGNTISFRPSWQVGNTVSDIAQKVKTQLKDGFRAEDWDFKKMRFAGDISYDIDVLIPRNLPEGSSVSVRTTSGDVKIEDLDASVSVATASGDIDLERLEGKVSAHSASGDVEAHSLKGSLETNTASGDISVEGGDAWAALRSVSGDISIRDFTLKNARVTTVSGTVTVNAVVNNDAEYTFDSVSGDMRLTTALPASGASLSFRSMSGDASVEGDWTKGSGKRAWTLRGQEGGPKISVKTVSGSLKANGVISGDLEARTESMPKDVTEDARHEDAATDESTGPNITVDADWERAKTWLKDISQRVSKFVNDLDAAGDRRYQERQTSGDETQPIDVTLSAPEAPEPAATAPTEPMPEMPAQPEKPEPPASPAGAETAPLPPTPPEAPEKPETSSERRLRLLQAVQRGELSVDEALAQLDDQQS